MKPVVIALVGNPNCGKTTLFNRLTGKQQQVGNWSGVTVEKKKGYFSIQNHTIAVVDLPGCYSYSSNQDENAVDERITYQYLASEEASLIVNVVDATNLERHLYLTVQLLEQKTPVIVVLNMMDAANKQSIVIDVPALAKRLGCPVIPLVAVKGSGVIELKETIAQYKLKQNGAVNTAKPWPFLSQALTGLSNSDILAAKTRYELIHHIISATVHRNKDLAKKSWTARIDSIVLNRFLGIPIFLALMYLVFIFTIQIAGSFQDFFNIASEAICIDATEQWLKNWHAPVWMVDLISYGIGQGINTVVSFIPVIAGMFVSLSFLEASGYMARVAFVMDKVMQWVGLPGKSFVPMIIGFGCNVPAVMATRTLESYRERVLTILMSPFMSCGARLAIYALFVSAFFPQNGHNVIFALYLIGITVALMTGLILRTTVLKGDRSALIIELPPYRWPSLKGLWRTTWNRLKHFILKAGTLILPLCVIFGMLTHVPNNAGTHNWVASFGRTLTPLFSPMGIEKDNWPATVGLLTGVLAKEVVVGTLGVLYAEEDRFIPSVEVSIRHSLKQAVMSIPNNLKQLDESIWHPLMTDTKQEGLNQGIIGVMVKRFGSSAAAFAYLLFVLLYFPCVSVVATMARELNKSWAMFSVVWTTGIAYITAVLFYQIANLPKNPLSSFIWIFAMLGILGIGLYGMRRLMHKRVACYSRALPTPILILDT